MCAKVGYLVAVLSVVSSCCGFQQQYFRTVPRSLRVQEGQEAVLECSVNNLHGMVQWAKDGFALGFSSVIPGYPRYTMFGDRRHGIYNLRIVNVTLEDDAEYQCQVGPAQMHKVIRANASLTVISLDDDRSLKSCDVLQDTAYELVTFQVAEDYEPQPDRDKIKLLLEKTHRGRALLKSEGAIKGLLDASQRKELANLIIDSVLDEDPGTQLTWPQFQSWARGIGELFVKESPVLYYASYIAAGAFQPKRNASGILYNIYLRKRKNLIKRKVTTPFRKRRALSESSDLTDVESPRCPIDLTVIDEGESDLVEEASLAITIAVEGATPWKEIDKYWRCTAKTRLQKLYNEKGTLLEYLNEYQVLRGPNGYKLLVADFDLIYPGTGEDILHSSLQNFKGNIIEKAKTLQTSTKDQLLKLTLTEIIDSIDAPPNAVEITNHPAGSKLEVKEGDDVSMECLVKNAKPAAKIVWFRGNVELKGDKVTKDEIKNVESQNGNPKSMRYTTISRVHFKASADDDYADFTCEARHEALQRDNPMRSTVQLSVLYPPGAPYIEGYAEGETVRRGQSLELVCRSRGGNPPAQLIWYKNGEQIRMAYRTSGRMSENVLSFKADSSDNKARYSCEAKNVMISNTLKAEIDLTVLFAPSHVSISGPSEARVGDPVPLVCSTAPSNPAAEIKWSVDGKHYKEASNRTSISPEGGWVTTSNITVTVEPAKTSFAVLCYGINQQLTENVVSSHTINVLYPPNAPMITGYVEGTTLVAGTVQKLSCISGGGNPLATLTWYKNDKKINSVTRTQNNSVSSEISILTNVTDNQAQYRCEATNSATEIPLFETVTLNVHFAPETVKVRANPSELKPGVEATLTCDAASSNPPAVLSWWRDGIPVQGLPMQQKKGLHGGTVSTIELKMNISKDLNGAVYTCQATNEALERSVNDALALKVLYAPIFDESTPYTTVGVESEPLIIIVRADGNPSSISYTWTKDGLPITQSSYSTATDRIISEGNMLNMTALSRHDAGVYTCEAVNSQGAAIANITVNVHYSASIKSVSQEGISNPKEDAMLTCHVIGNPLTSDHIRWERKNNPLPRDQISYDARNSTSYLLIKSPTRADVGDYSCVVDNGYGGESRQDVMLVVKFKPEMDSAPNLAKAASNVGQVGRLICKSKSAPAPNFTWSKNGAKLPVNTSTKYFAEYVKTNAVSYTSTLLINDVTTSDYGTYECGARNELGFSTTSVKLDITSAPDQVISLQVTNVTHNTATLQWQPGFDGGLYTWYRMRYRKIYDETYKYEDVTPKNATSYTISGLERNTDYVFSVMAVNKIGQSKYRPDDTKATTLSILPTSVQSSSEEFNSYSVPGVFIITGTIIGTALILLNVLLIGFCLHRRTNKRIRASSEVGELNVVSTEYVDSAADVSKPVIVYVSVTAAVLILINAGLVACFVLKRRARRLKEQAGQSSKSATIEMYAPSSYNDTMTGETLSSVSEKSETYSQDGDDRPPPPIPEIPSMPSRHNNMLSQTSDYLIEDQGVILPPPLDYPPPNYYEEHARTLPHPHRHKEGSLHATLGRSAGKSQYVPAPSPMPPLDGSYYNMASDRYLSYPPLIGEFLQQQAGRTPTPPQQYSVQSVPKSHLMNGGVGGSPSHMASPPHNYGLDISLDRQSAGGTLRRQRLDKMAVPPPDVTVLHPGNCNQHSQTPKQPQSILKDPSRHKYNQYGSPISSSTPQSNASQILTVQNLTSDVPQYGTIRKDKKQNVTIDESFNKRNETHVV